MYSLGSARGSNMWTEERDLVKKAILWWCRGGSPMAEWDRWRKGEGSFLEWKMEMQKWGEVALHAVGIETQKSAGDVIKTQKWYLVGVAC